MARMGGAMCLVRRRRPRVPRRPRRRRSEGRAQRIEERVPLAPATGRHDDPDGRAVEPRVVGQHARHVSGLASDVAVDHAPGTTISGVTLPSSAVTGFWSSRSPRAARRGLPSSPSPNTIAS